MREMVESYNAVLVIGSEGEKCRQVAESYSFRDRFRAISSKTTPFRKLTAEEHEKSRLH